MAVVPVGRHRRSAAGTEREPVSVERLFAVETAYLIAFSGALALALRFPEAAAVLCGIGGVTARTASREAARIAAQIWDRTHPGQARHAEHADLTEHADHAGRENQPDHPVAASDPSDDE